MAKASDETTQPVAEDGWEARFRASAILLSAISPLDRPIEQYVARLEARRHPAQIDWFDAGHTASGASAELVIGQTRRIIEFARSVVGMEPMI